MQVGGGGERMAGLTGSCSKEECFCSWLQDTVKRKLVDFAWNRRFFYLPGACLPFFGSTRLKVLINPIFFIRSACFDQSSGQPGVNPGKQEGGGAKKKKNRRVFFSRYLATNDVRTGCVRVGCELCFLLFLNHIN